MISKRAQAVDASGIRRVFDLAAKLSDPINLSIGQPDFDAPELVKNLAKEAIDSNQSGYTLTQGIPDLRAKIRARYGIEDDASHDAFVTAGVSGGLLLSYMVLLDPGDEILIPDPFFCIYRDLAFMLNAVPTYYDLYPDFALSAERIEASITDKTKAIVVNSPANPTGYACSQAELDEVISLAKKHDLVLIYDEIYDAFCYDSAHANCFGAYEKSIILNGFSKSGGVPGWRLGYVVAPKEIASNMLKIQQYSIVCANSIGQWGILGAFDFDFSETLEDYRAKRDLIVEGLKDHYNFVTPGGAFYLFAESPLDTSQAFVERCIEHNVLTVPGHVFSRKDTHFRISFSAPIETLERGIEVLRSLV